MIRVLALLVRRPDHTRDQFREHYETVHAPLALPQLAGVSHYVRQHLAPGLDADSAPFDVLSEFGYPDAEAVAETTRRLESPLGDPIRRDELRFMDKPHNTFFGLAIVMAAGIASKSETQSVALLARAPADVDRVAFADEHAENVAPLVRDASTVVTYRTLDGLQRAPYDAVTFLRGPHGDDALEALAHWRPETGDVLRLRTEAHVTRRASAWEHPDD
jgi:uncharacterized protein (TIGR02118 family)